MSVPSTRDILTLYKNLLRYGEQLKLTDKKYFAKRIKKEFKDNKDISEESQINFKFEVPTINDSDIEIQQVKGSGPGGSKINTTSSCIVLKHISTGIVVKCQETRSVEQNKKLAKLHLTTKLDNLFNGENSVEAQIKRLQERKSHKNELKKQKLRELKEKWKESLPD